MGELNIKSGQKPLKSELKRNTKKVDIIVDPALCYKKPGQIHPTPTHGSGTRVFYETLLRQNPNSPMAQKWCVENGVIGDDQEAERIRKIIEKRIVSTRKKRDMKTVRKTDK